MNYNDSAKWLLYTMHCDDSSQYGRVRDRILLKKVPLASLDIRLSYVDMRNDSLSLLYLFLYNDSTIVEQTNQKILSNGVKFYTRNYKVIGYIKGDYTISGSEGTRYQNALQPEIIAFIKNHKQILNPWFNLATRPLF